MPEGRTLQVVLAADTKKFRREMDRADKSVTGFGGKVSGLGASMGSMLGPAMAGAALAAGALAVKFGVDGVQAAMDDRDAVEKLTVAFTNVGLAQDVSKAEAFISAMESQVNVADEQLRPALTELTLKTGDLGKAQDLLTLALDVSAATGKPLEGIIKALEKGYDGNLASLGKLIPALDKTTIKSGDLTTATTELEKLYGGGAQVAADSYKGKIDGISLAFDNLKEAFGEGFLTAMDEAMTGMTGEEDSFKKSLEDLQEPMKIFGEDLGLTIIALADIVTGVMDVIKEFNKWKDAQTGPFATFLTAAVGSINALLAPVLQLAGALKEVQALWNSVTSSGAWNTIVGGSNDVAGGRYAGMVPSARGTSTVTMSAPAAVGVLNNVLNSNAKRTTGKVTLLR